MRIKLFDSSCFSQEYPKFPIHLGMCSYVYIEVEGKEKFLKINPNYEVRQVVISG